jgi:epoxide hydrolase
MSVEPFCLPFSDAAALDDLRSRLMRVRWVDEAPGSQWEYGVDLRFLREICSYWKDEFDWKLQIERLSAFHHYRFVSNGFGIHFIYERGKGPAPTPLIVTHGWPGSWKCCASSRC